MDTADHDPEGSSGTPDHAGEPDGSLTATPPADLESSAAADPEVAFDSSSSTTAWSEGWQALPGPARLIALMAVVVLSYGVVLMIASLRSILVMLLVSLFISFAMEPAVQFMGRRWGWRRGAATGVVFLGSILLLLAALGSVIPVVIDQMGALLRSAPRNAAELNDLFQRLPFVNFEINPDGELQQELLQIGRDLTGNLSDALTAVAGNVLGAAGNVVMIGRTAVGVLFQGLTVLLVSFYLVADGPRFRATLARPLPQHRQRELLAVWEIAVAKTGGYIYSRALLAGVAGAVTATFLAIIQIPHPLPLGLWVGVSGAFIPVIGTYLGGILALLVALAEDPIKAVYVLVFIAVYQQIENYLIAPRLQAATMDIHPAVAFVSVLVGATLLGAVGALLALPATAIIQAVASTYLNRNELIDELLEVSNQLDTEIPGAIPSRRNRPKAPA